MARGRFLSATVNTDRRLNALSVEAALIYLMAIPYLDRDGLMHGDPDIVQGSVCPKRRRLQLDSIIGEWMASGLVVQYECDEGPVLWFKGFTKNQQGMHYDREAPSRFPPPPGCHRNGKNGLIPDDAGTPPATPADPLPQPSESSPDEVRMKSGLSPAEVEVKDQVEEGESAGARARVTEPPESPPLHKNVQPLPSHLQNMLDHQNGIDVHYRSRNGITADAYTEQARKLGIEPPVFTARINALASCVGKRSYIDAAEDDNGALNALKGGVLTLERLGYHTEADYRQLCESFSSANTWMESPVPTLNQLTDHAGKLKDGVLDAKSKPRLPKPGPGGLYDFPTMAAMKEATAQNPDIRNRVTVKGTKVQVTM